MTDKLPPTKKRRPRGKPFGADNPGKQFVPGQSGNPGGRSRVVTEAYREWLNSCSLDADGKIPNVVQLARGLGLAAIGGNVAAAAEMRRAVEDAAPDTETSMLVVLDR